jgi:hypothetical protein
VKQRFFYRSPGLFVLDVSVLALSEPALRVERPEYAGCKTWVVLEEPVSITDAIPVAAG